LSIATQYISKMHGLHGTLILPAIFTHPHLLKKVKESYILHQTFKEWSSIGVNIIGKLSQHLPIYHSLAYRGKNHFMPQGASLLANAMSFSIEK
jgi:hypothetical protein